MYCFSTIHLAVSTFAQGSHEDWKTWKIKMVMEKVMENEKLAKNHGIL